MSAEIGGFAGSFDGGKDRRKALFSHGDLGNWQTMGRVAMHLFLIANIVTTSKALVTTSVALVTTLWA